MQPRRRIRAGLISILALFLASCVSSSPDRNEPGKRWNILFILADDLGWTDLGCYGSSFYRTPRIDTLAREGMRFTDGYAACPVCSPTRASIMTGKYPARLNLTDWIPGRQANRGPGPDERLAAPEFRQELPLDETTLAEALKASGYATFFAGKWHLGTESFQPEHQGFDTNIGGMEFGWPRGGYFAPWDNPKMPEGSPGEYLPDRLTDETIEFIRSAGDQPFFAYLSFYLVHNPLQGKEEKIEKYRAAAEELGVETPRFEPEGRTKTRQNQGQPVYAAMVESLDENVGRLLDCLSELGIADRTVVVFTSDNGGLATSEGFPTSNLPLRAGKGWLYEGGIRVPTLVQWPGETEPGMTSDVPVISTDFYPTLLEIAGVPPLPEQHRDGASLVPLLNGSGKLARDVLFWHYPHYSNQGGAPASAVRQGDWKLIQFFEDNHVELYNLADDPGETRDLSKERPAEVTRLLEILAQWQEETGARFPAVNPAYDPNTPVPDY